jgi:hypothetical protein
MALKAYVIAFDTSSPLGFVDRYLATQEQPRGKMVHHADDFSVYLRNEGLAARDRFPTLEEAAAYLNDKEDERYEQMTAVHDRASRRDFFGPDAWAAAEEAEVERGSGTGSALARLVRFMSVPHASTDQFVHVCDRELASECLRRARALSPQQIAAITDPVVQQGAVNDMWANFARYFRACNLHPYAWNRYQAAIESAIGYWEQRGTDCLDMGNALSSVLSFTPCVDGKEHMAIGMSLPGAPESIMPPQGMESLFRNRPTALAKSVWRDPSRSSPHGYWGWNYSAPWRAEALRRGTAIYGAGNTSRYTDHKVRFGSPSTLARARGRQPTGPASPCPATGLLPSDLDSAGCLGPSDDVHRLWVTNGALLGGFVNFVPGDDPVASGQFQRKDCTPRSMSDGRSWLSIADSRPAGITNEQWGTLIAEEQRQIVNGPGSTAWCCGALSRDDEWLYYLPPMIWYAQLLWPLLTYLAARDPIEVVYEVKLDVIGKNTWTMIATGHTREALAVLAESNAIRTAETLRAAVKGEISMVGGSLAAVTGLINPVLGAVVGLLATATQLLTDWLLNPGTGAIIDCFGRKEPVIEPFALVEEVRMAERRMVGRIMPVLDGYVGRDEPIVFHGSGSGGQGLLASVRNWIRTSVIDPRQAIAATQPGRALAPINTDPPEVSAEPPAVPAAPGTAMTPGSPPTGTTLAMRAPMSTARKAAIVAGGAVAGFGLAYLVYRIVDARQQRR